MPSQYVIKSKEGGHCEVLYNQAFSREQLEARYQGLLKNGWNADEAREEVANIAMAFETCSQDPEGYTPRYCWHFICFHIHPGDVVVDRGFVYLVNRPARA